ncbi:MAG: toll/interleukin-1 receptor domain-containing protein [Moraxellaceae bacterium]|nr:toll/interleukin-1 receptor domain-containing protein [Moraxellaceae bacterium]
MADVFISYASEDRASAHLLAQALAAQGWSVWWDREIVTGEAFDHAIERELEAAACVVVVWSEHSVASEWVKNEAAAAAERGVLLPLRISDVKLPLEFRRKQTSDLLGWRGEPGHEGFQALCRAITHVTQRQPAARPAVTSPPQPSASGSTTRPAGSPANPSGKRWFAVGATVAVLVLAGAYLSRDPATGKTDQGQEAGIDIPPAPAPVPAPAPTPSAEPGQADEVLADLVVGRYAGDVMSDSQGSSRNGVVVTVTKLDASTVRVTSPYARIGSLDIPLEKVAGNVVNAGGDSLFMVELSRQPPTLSLNPRGELAYSGTLKR